MITDGLPEYVIGSVFSITKYRVSVSWFFIGNLNSDPDLIQFQVPCVSCFIVQSNINAENFLENKLRINKIDKDK